MVIDKFQYLCVGTRQAIWKAYENGVPLHICNKAYQDFRQNLIDLIVELSQGANVDFDELNATMRDWR